MIWVRNRQETLLWLLVMYKNENSLWLPKPIIQMIGNFLYDYCPSLHVSLEINYAPWQIDVSDSLSETKKVIIGMPQRQGGTFIAMCIARSMLMYYPYRRVIYICTGEVGAQVVRDFVRIEQNFWVDVRPGIFSPISCYLLILDGILESEIGNVNYEKLLRIVKK